MEIKAPTMGKSTITVVIAFVALFFADKDNSCAYYWISVVFAVITSLLHLAVLLKYTWDFICKDVNKEKLSDIDYDKILSGVTEILKATKGK